MATRAGVPENVGFKASRYVMHDLVVLVELKLDGVLFIFD